MIIRTWNDNTNHQEFNLRFIVGTFFFATGNEKCTIFTKNRKENPEKCTLKEKEYKYDIESNELTNSSSVHIYLKIISFIMDTNIFID